MVKYRPCYRFGICTSVIELLERQISPDALSRRKILFKLSLIGGEKILRKFRLKRKLLMGFRF